MTLADYLKIEGKNASSMATAIGVAVSTITRAAKGEIYPTRKLMEAIYQHTDGLVTPSDFWDISAPSGESIPERTGKAA